MTLATSRTWLIPVLVAIAALVALALSFSSVRAQGAETARVRVMHASPDTPAVDIFVDDQKAVTGLAFPSDTGYVSLPAGEHNVKVFASPSDGSGTPALEADLTLEAGKDYSVLAVGLLADGSIELLPLEDNNASPAAGNAHVRLIHASPDAPAVDVLVSGTDTKVFSNVPFKGVGTYTPVPAGTYNLDVNVAGTDQTALTVSGLSLADQSVYTAVAVGLVGDGSLQVIPLADAAGATAPGAPAAGTGIAGSSDSSAWLLGAGLAALVVASASGLAVAARRGR